MNIWNRLRVFVNGTHFPLYLLRELKNEFHLLSVRWNNRLNPVQWGRRKQLESLDTVKLHFGCGRRILPGWVNVDGYHVNGISYVMDLRCALPLADNSTQFIFTEHVLEHLDYERDITFVLSEFHRVLKPGGAVRIIVPDLEKYCRAYVDNDRDWFLATQAGPPGAYVVNSIFMDHFHKFIYDFATMANCLKKAGFKDIVQTQYLNSGIPEVNLDTDVATRRNESLCVEAIKIV